MRKIFVALFLALSAGASPFLDTYLENGMEGVLRACSGKTHLDNFYDAAALHGLDPRGEHAEIKRLLAPHQDILRYVNVDPMIKGFRDIDAKINNGKTITKPDFNAVWIRQNPDHYSSLSQWASYLNCALLTKMSMSPIKKHKESSAVLLRGTFPKAVHFPLSMLHPQYMQRLKAYPTDYPQLYALEKNTWKADLSPSANFSRLASLWARKIKQEKDSDPMLAGILGSRRGVLCLLSPMDFKTEEAGPDAVLLETALNLSFKGKPGEALLGLVKFFIATDAEPNAEKIINMVTRGSELTDTETFKACMDGEDRASAFFRFGKHFLDNSRHLNFPEILRFFEAGGDLGHPESMYFAASLIALGYPGTAPNQKDALVWYEKSADLGWAPSQHATAIIYEEGLGNITINMEKARSYYEAAAAQNFMLAFPNLALLYEQAGELTKSLDLLVKGAIAGNDVSQNNLGNAYANGVRDKEGNVILPMDKKEALFWYQKSASQNYSRAFYTLAFCYENGQGVDQSFTEAAAFYKKAADLGFTQSKVNLAYYYWKGQGVEKDMEKAVQIWEEVGSQNERSLYNLGICYENGMGVRKDSKRAEALYEQAAKMGEDNAKISLSILRMKRSTSKKSAEKAYGLILEALGKKTIRSTQVGAQLMVTLSHDIMQAATDKTPVAEEESSEDEAEASADISAIVAPPLERQPSSDPELQAIFDEISQEEERWAQDRKRKRQNKVRAVFKNPEAEPEDFHVARPLLETAHPAGIAYFKAFYDPTAAEGLDRNHLATALGQLGCEIQGLPSGAGFMASYKMNSTLRIVWTCHNKHKTTRSSLSKGGLRRDLKTFLTKIGAGEEEIMSQ